MRFPKWMALTAAGLALGGVCGCESGSSHSDSTGSSSTNATPTPASQQLMNATVGIGMGVTYQTGVLTAPGAGTLTAHVRSINGSYLTGWFWKVADSTKHNETYSNDMTLSVATAAGETWRVQVNHISGTTVDTEITVTYIP